MSVIFLILVHAVAEVSKFERAKKKRILRGGLI